MNSSQLYLELLDSGERLVEALADEREANVFCAGISSYEDWQLDLGIARDEVERAAECYAVALKDFRMAMLSELDPSEPAMSLHHGRHSRHRDRAGATPAPCRQGGSRAEGKARKEIAEGFPVSTRLSRVPH
jgi:hypothetical protein